MMSAQGLGCVITRWRGIGQPWSRGCAHVARFEHIFPILIFEATMVREGCVVKGLKDAETLPRLRSCSWWRWKGGPHPRCHL